MSYRRAYTLLVGTAVVMGGLAIFVAFKYDKPLLDPEGSFLGPSYIRLPLLLLGALLLDLLPRTVFESRGRPGRVWPVVKDRLRTHWTFERMLLVFLGIVCFYITYVSYRNLKSNLPFVRDTNPDPVVTDPVSYDRELHVMDRVLFFGQDPSDVLHGVLGTNIAAHILSPIYLMFLPLVPLAVTAWLVWSRNLSYGYWFVTAQCIAWSLGTGSYYLLPTLGPGIAYQSEYYGTDGLAHTGTTDLMDSISNARHQVLHDPTATEIVNSIGGFASLHVAITLLVALLVQYTLRSAVLKWIFWVNFALTIVATLYFGWHYIADDIAGVTIAVVAFYLGGLASGQKFDRGFRSHPTTTTSKIPVDAD